MIKFYSKRSSVETSRRSFARLAGLPYYTDGERIVKRFSLWDSAPFH